MNAKRRLFWCHVAMVALVLFGFVRFLLGHGWYALIGPMLGPSFYVAVRIWMWRQDT